MAETIQRAITTGATRRLVVRDGLVKGYALEAVLDFMTGLVAAGAIKGFDADRAWSLGHGTIRIVW